MKIAVTGTSGFIGSAIVTRLGVNHDVLGIARTPRDEGAGLAIIHDYFELTPEHFADIDCVIHTAGVATSSASEASLQRGNVELSGHIAGVVHVAEVPAFLNLSSVKACGEGDVGPDLQCQPQTAYGLSKFTAERAIDEIFKGTEMRYQHIRLPLVYSRSAENNFAKLLGLSRLGLPLPYSSLTGCRSFCALSNLLNYLGALLDQHIWPQQAFVADRNPLEVGTLIKHLALAQGKDAVNLPLPRGWLKYAVSALTPTLAAQLFEDAGVDVRQTVEACPQWRPLTTKEAIQQEFLVD